MAGEADSRASQMSAIRRVVCRIPPGRVATYGEVAREAGLGRRARFVGKVLARLPEGSQVPWHRVIRAGGRLAFEPGTELHQRQRSLLETEGVVFSGTRVDLRRYGRQASLDELLWGEKSSHLSLPATISMPAEEDGSAGESE